MFQLSRLLIEVAMIEDLIVVLKFYFLTGQTKMLKLGGNNK